MLTKNKLKKLRIDPSGQVRNSHPEITFESEEDDGDCQHKLKELKLKLKKNLKERDDYLAGWQRAKADLINTQQRFEKHTQEICALANFDLVKNLLPILDSLDKIMEKDSHLKTLREQTISILRSIGLQEILVKLGDKFDHNYHEVVLSKGDGETITEIAQKGYVLNDKVVRPVKVIVE